MHVYLAARHLQLNDSIRDYVETRLVGPIREHNRLKITRVEIQLFAADDSGPKVGCHVLVSIKGAHEINVREIDGSLYEAIDLAKDRVMRQLTEQRDRMLTRSRHPKKYSFARLARALGWARSRQEPA